MSPIDFQMHDCADWYIIFLGYDHPMGEERSFGPLICCIRRLVYVIYV